MEFRTISNYVSPPGETFLHESLTVPDQVLSIQEILQRYVRGQAVESYSGTYDDDLGFVQPDLSQMELNEIYEYKQDLEEYIRERRAAVSRKPATPDVVDDDNVVRPVPAGEPIPDSQSVNNG